MIIIIDVMIGWMKMIGVDDKRDNDDNKGIREGDKDRQ